MPDYLGIDTSNYTTSAAVYRSDTNKIFQAKRPLPVKDGQAGLRQSDAVFHHTAQLPSVIEELTGGIDDLDIKAVCASVKPRNAEGSYMPCFLCGESMARGIAAAMSLPFYGTSHQTGHILAALYSADAMHLSRDRFIAFHISGGTTECLLCEPCDELIIKTTVIGQSLDLKAGQAIDRTGVMLGFKFPCGRELEKIAESSSEVFNIKPVLRGNDCCLSGLENKCRDMYGNGTSRNDTAKYCLDFIGETVLAMTDAAVRHYSGLPLIYAGGVMSNKGIAGRIISRYNYAKFAKTDFSCDNAAGTALTAYSFAS